ncbi:MAG: transcriptional regulator [Acidobacteriota bacterium]
MISTREKEIIKVFKNNGGVLRQSNLRENGFHQETITSLYKKGIIEKINRGLYKLKEYEPDNNLDLVYASLQTKKGVVCLISALSFHEITDEIPDKVQLAIPKGARRNKIIYPKVKFYNFSEETWEAGIEEIDESGHTFRVYSAAKTIADCIKFRSQIGMDVVIDAIKRSLKDNKTDHLEIFKYTELCRVDKIARPILEALI